MVNQKYKATQADSEISSADIIQFFIQNAKLIGIITVSLSILAIALSLLTPKQYQKQLNLLVKSTPIPLSAQPIQSFPALDSYQTSGLAVEFARSIQIDEVSVQAQPNNQTQEISLYLQSANVSALKTSNAQILSQLEAKFQVLVRQALQTSLMTTTLQLNKQKQILPQLEQKIAQLPPTNTAKLQGLETKRAESVATIAALEFDKDYLEQSQKNLADFTGKVVSVQVMNESGIQPIGSLKQLVVVAVITSLIAAILAVIICNQIVRWMKDKRSQQKIHGSTDV